MTEVKVYDEASRVDAEDAVVVVVGPGDLDLRFTPRAAEETSERLTQGAMKARSQLHFGEDRPI